MKFAPISWQALLIGIAGLVVAGLVAYSVSRIAGVVMAMLAAAAATREAGRFRAESLPPNVTDPIGSEVRAQAEATYDETTRAIEEDRDAVVAGHNRGVVVARLRGLLRLKGRRPGAPDA